MALYQNVHKFRAQLSGEQEVPPVNTIARGQFRARLQASVLEFKLFIREIEGLTAAHIHLGRPGENGPVVAFLYGPAGPSGLIDALLVSGSITGEDLVGPLLGRPLKDLIREILRGNAYVNAHTQQNPGGEIRGQIEFAEEEHKNGCGCKKNLH